MCFVSYNKFTDLVWDIWGADVPGWAYRYVYSMYQDWSNEQSKKDPMYLEDAEHYLQEVFIPYDLDGLN